MQHEINENEEELFLIFKLIKELVVLYSDDQISFDLVIVMYVLVLAGSEITINKITGVLCLVSSFMYLTIFFRSINNAMLSKMSKSELYWHYIADCSDHECPSQIYLFGIQTV